MPFLTADQFAEFYECIAEGEEKVMELTKNNIQVEDGFKRPKSLLRIALFNDFFRTDIGWLEFWVYVCADGVKPNEDAYMSVKPMDLAE